MVNKKFLKEQQNNELMKIIAKESGMSKPVFAKLLKTMDENHFQQDASEDINTTLKKDTEDDLNTKSSVDIKEPEDLSIGGFSLTENIKPGFNEENILLNSDVDQNKHPNNDVTANDVFIEEARENDIIECDELQQENLLGVNDKEIIHTIDDNFKVITDYNEEIMGNEVNINEFIVELTNKNSDTNKSEDSFIESSNQEIIEENVAIEPLDHLSVEFLVHQEESINFTSLKPEDLNMADPDTMNLYKSTSEGGIQVEPQQDINTTDIAIQNLIVKDLEIDIAIVNIEGIKKISKIGSPCPMPEEYNSHNQVQNLAQNEICKKRIRINRQRRRTIIGSVGDFIDVEECQDNINCGIAEKSILEQKLTCCDGNIPESNVGLRQNESSLVGINNESINETYENTSVNRLINHNGVNINSLDEYERNKFYIFCRGKLEKMNLINTKPKRNVMSRLCGNLFKFCFKNKQNDDLATGNLNDHNEISPFVYHLGEYLLKNGGRTSGIFRCSANPEFSKIYPFEIHAGKAYNPENFSINDNAVVFKAYLREVVNGLFTEKLSSNVLDMYKKAKIEVRSDPIIGKVAMDKIKNVIQLYMPFALNPHRHKLLKLVFKLFQKVSDNFEETEITINGLSIIFGPNIFPLASFKEAHDYNIIPEIIETLFYSDINCVDEKVYQEFLRSDKLQHDL